MTALDATRLDLPIAVPTMRELHVGEQVSIHGTIYTARSPIYEFVRDGGDLSFVAAGSLLYHSAPVGRKRGKKWSVMSLAPDQSSSLDPFVREMLVRSHVRGIIGRGELGKNTIEACRQYGACYLQTLGGAGPLLAQRVNEVTAVHLTDKFDNRSAVWELVVEAFPAIVMIDSHGQSLYDMIRDVSNRRLLNLQF